MKYLRSLFLLLFGCLLLAGPTGRQKHYNASRQRPVSPVHKESVTLVPVQTGKASWYGKAVQGNATRNGEIFDADGQILGREGCLTAAHCGIMRARGFKGGEWVLVEYKRTGKAVWVWINDTGGFEPHGRIIDLSYKAAKLIGMVRAGIGTVKIYRLLENQRRYPI